MLTYVTPEHRPFRNTSGSHSSIPLIMECMQYAIHGPLPFKNSEETKHFYDSFYYDESKYSVKNHVDDEL